MNDTTELVKKIHLQIWLSKTPGERLRQFLISNQEQYAFWKIAKDQMEKKYPGSTYNPS